MPSLLLLPVSGLMLVTTGAAARWVSTTIVSGDDDELNVPATSMTMAVTL